MMKIYETLTAYPRSVNKICMQSEALRNFSILRNGVWSAEIYSKSSISKNIL